MLLRHHYRPTTLDGLVGREETTQQIKAILESNPDKPVKLLLYGAKGSGKDTIARCLKQYGFITIHQIDKHGLMLLDTHYRVVVVAQNEKDLPERHRDSFYKIKIDPLNRDKCFEILWPIAQQHIPGINQDMIRWMLDHLDNNLNDCIETLQQNVDREFSWPRYHKSVLSFPAAFSHELLSGFEDEIDTLKDKIQNTTCKDLRLCWKLLLDSLCEIYSSAVGLVELRPKLQNLKNLMLAIQNNGPLLDWILLSAYHYDVQDIKRFTAAFVMLRSKISITVRAADSNELKIGKPRRFQGPK